MKDKILLFIPMYNCEKQIIRVLDQLTDEVSSYLSEVIIVNNRSTDNGEDAVLDYLENTSPKVRTILLRNDENYGLGGSHKVAFDYALEHGFDYVIVLHGDDQGNIDNLLPYLRSGAYNRFDCFLGARFMKGSSLQGYSAFRTFGNRVYNILFSFVCGTKIRDLGSGLNMYKTDILESGFYEKYPDNLMFNYCMIMGSCHFGHKICFFPISWREDDQVSNVKMTSQAIKVLKLLLDFAIDKSAFVRAEHRDVVIDDYSANRVRRV
ncbi:MAG: glycosyltransferase family 2 protein [Lachnospiraceae bacterium]|nr:glycosyltransferase family 2 protein [Lachnospiraceae bacterium]